MNTCLETNELLEDALMRMRYQNRILKNAADLKEWVDVLLPFGEQAVPHAAEVLSQLQTQEKWLNENPDVFEPLGRLASSSGHRELMNYLRKCAKEGKPLAVYHLFCISPSLEFEKLLIHELERLGTREYGVAFGLDRGMILFALSDYGTQESLRYLKVLEKDLLATIQLQWTRLQKIMTEEELTDLEEIQEDAEMMMWGPGGGWRGEQLSIFQHICRLGGFHGDVEHYGELLQQRLESENHPESTSGGEA